MSNWIKPVFYAAKDPALLGQGFTTVLNAVDTVSGIFLADQLFTYGKNLGFLEDQRFMAAVAKHAGDGVEQSIIWRTHVLCWAGKRGLKYDGDFVECGTYKGTSARIMVDYLDFAASGRTFHLYDLFEHHEGMVHQSLPELGADLYGRVCDRFADVKNVRIVKGSVHETLQADVPERIAFLHIDMNNAPAEREALERLFSKVLPGASIVFDDYGWSGYRDQKDTIDAFLGARGYEVLELPTGQGLVIK